MKLHPMYAAVGIATAAATCSVRNFASGAPPCGEPTLMTPRMSDASPLKFCAV